jgi:hypothetical protein
MKVQDQFWGARFRTITDPFGHVWSIATHVEDVPEKEMAERARGRDGADRLSADGGRPARPAPTAERQPSLPDACVIALNASAWPLPYHELWPGPPWQDCTAPLLTPVNDR